MTRTGTTARLFLLIAGFVAAAPPAAAQVKYPKPPDKLDVQIWYRIRGDRDLRVPQFRALVKYLKSLGYTEFPRADADLDITNEAAERFYGSIPSANVYKILDDPRVRAIQFTPPGFQPAGKPVPVRIGIATGFPLNQQRLLHQQVVDRLRLLGFREAIGYDTIGHTIIRGDIPPETFPRLMRDLRREPAGWFLSGTEREALPAPIREVLPVRWVQVLPDADLNFFTPAVVDPSRSRFTADLRAVLEDANAQASPLRVEVALDAQPDIRRLDALRAHLRSDFAGQVKDPDTGRTTTAFASLDGVSANILTVRFLRPADAIRFADEPGVLFMRLPQAATQTTFPVPATLAVAPDRALAAAHLDQLHKLGHRGRGVRVVVIASDFPGVAAQILAKRLPANTEVIDLTTELSPVFDPYPSSATDLSGLAAARALHLAAPDAQLLLVRVDPTAEFQIHDVAQAVRGNSSYSQAMQSRIVELSTRDEELRRLYRAAIEEYRAAIRNPSDEEEPRQRLAAARQQLELLGQAQKKVTARTDRFEALFRSVVGLAHANVVVNTLVWDSGYPLDGLSFMSRTIDLGFASDAIARPVTRSATRPRYAVRTLWVQAASPSAGSVWGGRYLDVDENGAMEFAAPRSKEAFPTVASTATTALTDPPGGWTRELNFLAVLAPDGATSSTLTAGTRIRLTIQWREPHEPATHVGREAIFPLTLRVFRQLDPTGEKRASDELEEVARSVGSPEEIRLTPTYGVYEQTVEFAVPAAGRYCVRVDGRPAVEPLLPALRQKLEIAPRMIVEFVGSGADKGRPVFETYAPRDAGVGVPGDAKAALTVGATGTLAGMTGGGTGVTLLLKPDLVSDGAIDLGTGVGGSGVAAGFVGGMAAATIGAGMPSAELLRHLGIAPGGPAVVPETWLRYVPPRQSVYYPK